MKFLISIVLCVSFCAAGFADSSTKMQNAITNGFAYTEFSSLFPIQSELLEIQKARATPHNSDLAATKIANMPFKPSHWISETGPTLLGFSGVLIFLATVVMRQQAINRQSLD